MISIRFIAGCGPSQVLPHTEGVMKKCQKMQASPRSVASAGTRLVFGGNDPEDIHSCSVSSCTWGSGKEIQPAGPPLIQCSESARSSLSSCRALCVASLDSEAS